LRNFAADTPHSFARPIERIEPCHARTPSHAVTERPRPPRMRYSLPIIVAAG
jgi:hypothetical protein